MLRIALLGSPHIMVDDRPFEVDTRKATALLAYLACSEGPVGRDTAAALLWPEYPTDRARSALRRTLSTLKKGLHGQWLEVTRQQIALPPGEDLVIDVARFGELAGTDDPSLLAEAASLYGGDFMSGFALRDSPQFDEWQMNQAAVYRRLASSLLDRLSAGYAERGEFAAGIEAAARWLRLDPLHEPAHRRLMLLHAWAGDRSSAVQQYRHCVRTFEDELGVPPLEETSELHREIVENRLSRPAHPPPEAPVEPMAAPLTEPEAVGFVGRESNLARLTEAYQQARDRVQVVLIRGEAGIGKTRLAEEFLGGLDEDVAIIRANGHPAESSLPFGVSVSALRAGLAGPGGVAGLRALPDRWLIEAARLLPEVRDLLPDLPEPPPLEGPGGHQRMLEGIARVTVGLSADDEPGVVLLDDLQWADSASLEVISTLTHRISQQPGLVLVLYRSEDLPRDHPLAALSMELRRSDPSSAMELGRLSREQVTELTGDLPPTQSEELYRLSEGVPYFLAEYLSSMAQDPELAELPSGVRDLLASRVTPLSELGGQVLSAASVIGGSFDFATLQTASGRSDEETLAGLEELNARGLVREAPGDSATFDFDHNRMRQFAYESMNTVRRRLLHGRVADMLLAAATRDARQAAVTAAHLERAARTAEAAEQHLIAADRAADLSANADALQHYEAALALDHEEISRIREAMGDVLVLLGDYGAALSYLEAAAAEAAGADLGRLERKIGTVHARAGDLEMAQARYAAAAKLLTRPADLSSLHAAWSWTAHRRGDRARAKQLGQEALDAASIGDDKEALAEAHNVLGMVERSENVEAARHHHETSLALVADRDPAVQAAALNNLALTYLAAGNPGEGLDYAERALELCIRLGDRHKEAAVHNNLADLLHAAGREEEAVEHLKAAAAIFSAVGMEPGALEPEIWMLTEW